tara:strand:+ start:2747 stop:3712 length:966 start_codon:yes stop_codon:yes gene_type:complete
MKNNVIILAAGKGTRMKSNKLKVLHELAGKPIIQYVIDAVNNQDNKLYIVIGHQGNEVEAIIGNSEITYVEQKTQLGTGHAVQQVMTHLNEDDDSSTLILTGDSPLIQKDTLAQLIAIHNESNASATILTTMLENPHGYGRILRGEMGTVLGIKEQKDCNEEEAQIKEINSGVYIFNTKRLVEHIFNLSTNNKQKEYYLTDIIEILKTKGEVVTSFCTENNYEVLGINTRLDLSKANQILFNLNNEKLMKNGVTIIDPRSTFIDSTVQIGNDTIIEPFTILRGKTTIGSNCHIGPYVELNNVTVEKNSTITLQNMHLFKEA